MRLSPIFILFTTLLLPISSFAGTLPQKISEDTVIEGEVTVSDDVVVEKGAALTVKSGTKVTFENGSIDVYGTIIAEGNKGAEIHFLGAPNGKNRINGIRIINSKEKQSKISHALFKGLNTAVQVISSSALIEKSLFDDNKIAIDAKQKDEAEIKGNTIKNCKKVGVFLKSDSNAKVVGNKISGIKKFGIYIHRSGGVSVSDNEITSCNIGVMVAFVGTDPAITGNEIKSNKTGISVEKGANPKIERNTIYLNRTGISVSKRSDPEIISNDIIDNKMGVFVTYSSYPTITKNNLLNNEHSVYLEFQSAQWEKEQGEKMERGGDKPGGKKMGAFGGSSKKEHVAPKKNVSSEVFAEKNFWGDDITQEMDDGNDNISAIYDFYDANLFTDAGKKYKLDKVNHMFWSRFKFENKEKN